MWNDLLFRVRSLFRKKAVEADLDEELRFHLAQQTGKYLRSGLTQSEALRQVRVDFGGLDQVKEECRDARGIQLMETLLQDFRYGARTLRKSPGFTAAALLTLALGIGANTAIFSVVYGILLRPLPYHDPARLVALHETTPKVGTVSVSYPDFLDWREQSRSFSELTAVGNVSFNLAGILQPESITGEAVSSNFLSMMGIRPALGRDFTAAEDKPGVVPVVLLSYPLWQSHFAGDVNALGRAITLDGRAFTVIGVLPEEFRSIDKTDVLEPIGVWATGNSSVAERGDRGDMAVIGRLAPGVALGQARAEMEGIAARLAREYPASNDQFGVALLPIRDVFVGNLRPAILVLFAAVLFVLLIACANVANLFLMRASGRSREIALRIAIGAGRGRIIRQLLTESLLLALLGGVLGVLLAMAGIRGIANLIPMDALAGATINLNAMVLLFAALVALASALIFGLTPAIHATRADVQSELKEGGRSATAGAGQNRWRGILVSAEIALALVLLVGAGLMMKSLYRLLSVDPGFRTARVLTMEIMLNSAAYQKDGAILNFWQQLLDRASAVPGVESAALGSAIPLSDNHSRSDISFEGMPAPKAGSYPHPDVHVISPAYMNVLGISLRGGRMFAETDRENAPPVAIINDSLARQFFPNQDPVGKRLMFGHPMPGRPPAWITIAGVAGDTKLYGLDSPSRFEVYLPLRQRPRPDMGLLVKSKVDPAALTSAIRGGVAAIDKDQPIFAIATMGELLNNSVSTRRITLILLGMFSALALLLAAIGIYGVISYSVAQRTHEIGIRVALGAQRRDVMRMILIEGARVVGAGVAIGIAASFALTRLMAKLLYAVSAADPATFIAVTAALALVASLACYLPARRTLRVDAMVALRYE